MDEVLKDLGELIAAALFNEVTEFSVDRDELTVCARADQIIRVVKFLRDDSQCQFRQLIDICGVDYPDRPSRFDIVYHFLSHKHNQRVRVKVQADQDMPVPSLTGVFSAAGWFERECWDMYGVMFSNHPDLRRLLTDYGFQGFPLRKDFPLTGFVEVRYSEDQKRVVYEPVTLTQDFRSFDFMSPWEGAKYILPGDEKSPSSEGEEA
jgi:NADH-quinone oxidoreductase subunit C